MARGWAYGIAAAGLVLAGCGPMALPEAETLCAETVAPKAPLSGEGRMGVTSGGAFESGVKLTFTMGSGGGDPGAAYDRCVRARAGQGPSRPYYTVLRGRG